MRCTVDKASAFKIHSVCQKSFKNHSKMVKKSIKIHQKSIKNRSTNHPNNTTSKKSKMLKNHGFLYGFCYFGHLMLGSKIVKNRPNILPKTAFKSMVQFRSILEPTWLHFERILGAKMEPSRHKIAPKVDPKNDQKMITFWIALGTDFNRF